MPPWSVCTIFDDSDDCYWAWNKIYGDICDHHTSLREVKLRSISLPWISLQIRHKMNLRYKLYLNAKRSDDEVLWSNYRKIRNEITQEVRMAKSNYYKNLFDEVNSMSVYWKLIKKETESRTRNNIIGIRNNNGAVVINNKEKAEILNEHFATVGEKVIKRVQHTVHTYRIPFLVE